MVPSLAGDFVGELLYIVGTGPRVDFAANLRFVLDINLGVAGYTRTEVGRQGNSLVEGIGVERLGVAENGCHGFHAGAAHVVERVLFGERPSGGLRVGAEHHRLRVLGAEALGDLGPQHTGGAHLGNLHEVVHTDGPEEGKARGEGIDVDAGVDTRAEVVHAVGQRIGQLNVGGGTGFLHVVTGDGDAVELRHLL